MFFSNLFVSRSCCGFPWGIRGEGGDTIADFRNADPLTSFATFIRFHIAQPMLDRRLDDGSASSGVPVTVKIVEGRSEP